MKTKALFFFILISFLSKAQTGLIKDIRYEQDGFIFLFDVENSSCESRESDEHTFIFWETDRPARNFATYYGFNYGGASNLLKGIRTKVLNAVSDSAFIEETGLNEQVLIDISTTTHCDSITSICTTDTNWIEYGGVNTFYYVDHIFNKPNNNLYTLFSNSKAAGSSIGFNEKFVSNYIIKTKANYHQNNSTNEDNTIYAYHKFNISNNTYKLFEKEENTIVLLEHENSYATENVHAMSLKFKTLNTDLQLQDSILKVHSLFGDTLFNDFTFEFKRINNNIYLIAQHITTYLPIPDYFIYVWKYDNDFNLLDSARLKSTYERDNYFSKEQSKHYFYSITDSSTEIHLTNISNDTIRSVSLPTTNKILVTNDSSFIMLQLEFLNTYNYQPVLYKWNKNGILDRIYHLNQLPFFADIYNLNEQNLKYAIDSFNNIVYGYSHYESSGCSHGYFNSYGIFNLNETTNLSGNIVYDANNNCQKDTLESNVKNILIELQLNNKTFYTNSDEFGNFQITPYDTGHAKVILHLQNQSVFETACQDTFNVILSDMLTNPELNFLLKTPVCGRPVPKISVDISTPFLRRCFDNLYTLTLYNESTDTAYTAVVDVLLDDDLIPIDTAFATAENLGNNAYRFYFENVTPLQTIRKTFLVNVNCATTILGETHCVKAISYPYEICDSRDDKYMQAETSCQNDSVVFIVSNISLPETFTQPYRIFVNDSIRYAGIFSFTPAQVTARLAFHNPNGQTFRLETRQYPQYPNEDTILSVAIEGCGNANSSTGYITQFNQDDDKPNVSIDCHQNVGSFDPNEKTAQPVGYSEQHLIENNQAIEYTIQFQNLGSFPASFVTITDTLAPVLDITTLRIISASHNYQVSIKDSNIITFSFPEIELAHADSDSLLSNGYIRFSIIPKKDLPTGTAIENKAYITFDYNEAIQTNTVHHEIGRDFFQINIISLTSNPKFRDMQAKVYPNPASQHCVLEFGNTIPEDAVLRIYTVNGIEVYTQQPLRQFTYIPVNKWSSGIYLFEIRSGTELMQSGKIAVQ